MREVKPRPKRRAIPLRVKQLVCIRQDYLCARCRRVMIGFGVSAAWTRFDHEPALRLRDVNRRRSDYVPPQHSPEHIDALCDSCHDAKTRGTGATTAGTDIWKIKKERKRERKARPRMKRRLGKRKMQSRPWQKRP